MTRIGVAIALIALYLASLSFLGIQLLRNGGGGYGDVIFVLGAISVVFSAAAVVGTGQWLRGKGRLLAAAIYILSAAACIVLLALSIGLRG